jgi:hypothetical protein
MPAPGEPGNPGGFEGPQARERARLLLRGGLLLLLQLAPHVGDLRQHELLLLRRLRHLLLRACMRAGTPPQRASSQANRGMQI